MNARLGLSVVLLLSLGCGNSDLATELGEGDAVTSEGELQCGALKTELTFSPASGWWNAKDDASLSSQRAAAQSRAQQQGALVANEQVTRIGAGPRWTYRYQLAWPEAALPQGVHFSLGGCTWTTRDAQQLAALRERAAASAKAYGSEVVSERVVAAPGGNWSYTYRWDFATAAKAEGVTFIPADMDWRTDDASSLSAQRVQAERMATAQGAHLISETVTSQGDGTWVYAYRFEK